MDQPIQLKTKIPSSRNSVSRSLVAIITLLLAAMAGVQIVHAAVITVINTSDSGLGSLRQALADANDGDTINFSPAVTGTITLTSGELLVSDSITISGPGANILAVNGNAASRVFNISSGKTVTISGLTITNGSAPDSRGGGIYNDHATLTVSNCTFSSNSAAFGGGIFNDAEGGSATLTINKSTFSGNSVNGTGGGIINHGLAGSATLTINNSTFSGNSAFAGGGIHINGNSGSATLTINNSTVSGNSATFFFGGGISNDHGTLTIGDTILKTGASGQNIRNFGGTVTSLGYNLSSDAAGGDGTTGPGGLLNATGDIRNTDPKLGPLADNGGPTFTHALCTASVVPDASCTGASPAIDAGKNFTTATTDQRGFFRTFDNFSIPNATGGDGTDIGAFEVQATVCPEAKGFWKNNPAAWPASALPMTLGSQTYNQTELLAILQTPIKGVASLILADQLIAAKLNIANANGTPVASTVADADAVLSLYTGKLPYRVRPNSTNGQRMVNDANALDSYNNGVMTPGCTP
jgi:hypothetical protein